MLHLSLSTSEIHSVREASAHCERARSAWLLLRKARNGTEESAAAFDRGENVEHLLKFDTEDAFQFFWLTDLGDMPEAVAAKLRLFGEYACRRWDGAMLPE